MTKPHTPKKAQALTIAVGGEGVTPRDLPLRRLAELLEATASTIEAVAAEKQVEVPRFSVAKVLEGSAAYRLVSEDEQALMVHKSVLAAVRSRGRTSSLQTRNALLRLHQVASKTGPLRFKSEIEGKKTEKVLLSVPVELDDTFVEDATVVYGRVIGAKIVGTDDGEVTIRYDDGGSGEFEADLDILARAAALIGRHVTCRVTFQRGAERDMNGRLDEVEERPQDVDIMTELMGVREQLRERGIVIDAEAWLREEEQQ